MIYDAHSKIYHAIWLMTTHGYVWSSTSIHSVITDEIIMLRAQTQVMYLQDDGEHNV